MVTSITASEFHFEGTAQACLRPLSDLERNIVSDAVNLSHDRTDFHLDTCYQELSDILVTRNLPISSSDNVALRAYAKACSFGDRRILELFLSRGFRLKESTGTAEDFTNVDAAVLLGNVELVKEFKERGVRISVKGIRTIKDLALINTRNFPSIGSPLTRLESCQMFMLQSSIQRDEAGYDISPLFIYRPNISF